MLVIGGSPSGVAAAIQCARSKVKTILAEQDTTPLIYERASGHSRTGFITVTPGGVTTLKGDISSGIWDEFRKRFREYHKEENDKDKTHNSSLAFDSWSSEEILKSMMDTAKNLTIYTNTTVNSVKKDNDFWDVNITQGGKNKTIRTRVIVDATRNGTISAFAGATYFSLDSIFDKPESNLYRTSIAMGDGLPGERYNDIIAPKDNYPPFPTFCIPIKAVLARGVDNILFTEKLFPEKVNLNYFPRQLTLGQGVGTVAAYCAFYKTTTKKLNVRAIQEELLDFKGYLMPFSDINLKDQDWRAIQQICATGLLKGVLQVDKREENFLFKPDSEVKTAEIEPVLTEIYTRAFLWFSKEKPRDKFTVANTLSFISDYTLTDPLVLKSSIQKGWETKFNFKLDFDLDRPVTRREFAVLANKYLNPFARTVDLNGKLVN